MKANASRRAEPSLAAPASGRNRFGLPLLLLITALAYLNSFAGSWQFDDYAVLLSDPRVQSLDAWWTSLPHLRPLFKLSVAINHQLGAGLLGFHAVNLGLHLINVALLFALLRMLLAPSLPEATASFTTLFVCAVFALHPAQTEAVTYLSGRSVSLEAMALLLAMCAWQRWLLHGNRRWLLAVLIALLLALASRESAVIAPLLLAWLTWLHRQPQHLHRDAQQQRLADATTASSYRSLLFALLSAALLLSLILLLPRYRELLWLALQWQGFDVLFATQTQAIVHLLAVTVGLAPVNADPALTIAPLFSWRGQFAGGFVLLAAVCCWRQGLQQPLLRFALGWLFIIWLPTHSIFVRLDPVNDRQLYLALPALALMGIVALRAWLFARWSLLHGTQQRRGRAVLLVSGIALVLLLAAATAQRNTVYQSETLFWRDVVAKAPHNARAWNNLGIAYAAAGARTLSEQAFQQALLQQPNYVRAAINLRLLRAGWPLSEAPDRTAPDQGAREP